MQGVEACGHVAQGGGEGRQEEDKKEKLVLPECADDRPLVLTQACLAVILYAADRNVILRYRESSGRYLQRGEGPGFRV
jgi:hypothetical protein